MYITPTATKDRSFCHISPMTESKQFHYPSFSSFKDRNDKNKQKYSGIRDKVITSIHVNTEFCSTLLEIEVKAMQLISILMFGLIEIVNGICIVIMIWGQFAWDFKQGMFGRLVLLVLTIGYSLLWLRLLQMMIKRIKDYVKDHRRT